MENSIIGTLEESRCMALADFYLGQVAPNQDGTRPLKLTSLDDLYHYLLLDTQVGKELETSRLAEAIACLQQYIGAIYSGLEPGHTDEITNDELVAWHQRYCNISDWAGYQMLLDYPENWINPTLRLNKSESFKELENNLGQANLSDASVQTALFEHLKQFEEVCNLDLVSAYIDGVDGAGEEKGQDFKNADYYFVGRQRVQPFGYFWRKVHVDLNAQSKFLNPALWGTWEPIGIPASSTVLAMRPVFFAARLMVVYVEGEKAPDRKEQDNDGNDVIVEGTWKIEAKLSFLNLDKKTWSTPESLGKKEFAKASEASSRLVVVTIAGARKDVDDRLAVCFTTTDLPSGQVVAAKEDNDHGWLFATINALKDHQVPDVGSLKQLANERFSNRYGLQHKLLASEAAVLSQALVPPSIVAAADNTREGLLSKYISMNLNFSSRQVRVGEALETENVLQVQGVCDFAKYEYRLQEINIETVVLPNTEYIVSRHSNNELRLYCFRPENVGDFAFCLDDLNGNPVEIETFLAAEFTAGSGGYYLIKHVSLSQRQLENLSLVRNSYVTDGAGFTVLIDNHYLPLRHADNKLSISKEKVSVDFGLKIQLEKDVAPVLWQESVELGSWFQTPWIEFRWRGEPVGENLNIVWGEVADGRYGRDRYNILIKQAPNASNVPLLSKQASGAQFLDVRPLGISTLQWVRLNSLFGPELVARAAISVDEVLSYATQNTLEPAPSGTNPANTPIDFNSAHGTFYWELFFHLPFLIAHRLCEERNYHESQRWYQYIFNPHIRAPRPGETPPSDRYWLCRPLLEEGNIGFEAKGLVDPDAIAFSDRIHYRKAIFMGYVRCIIAHADSLYRRLTRDSLVAAKLQYVRALSLMGPAPTAKAMSHWKPQSAADILDSKTESEVSSLNAFAWSLGVDVANLPARVEGTPDFELLGLEDVFRPFTNDQLLDTWKYIEECLWNMRHNLTIDGKPMMLALYAPPTNPLDLLRAQAGGSSGATRNAGGWKNIPHYRFRTLMPTAKDAVQTLIGFGREVRQLMELRDRGQLEELQQSHVIALGAHARTIQEETIKQLEASLKGLKQSQKMIEERARHYKELNNSSLLAMEIAGDTLSLVGKLVGAAAAVPTIAAGVARLAPNVFGLANGGMDYGAPLYAASSALGLAGATAYAGGEAAQRSAFYLRREQEWSFAENQANSELQVIEEQLTAQEHALNAARASLAQTQKANDQAQELYSFYKTRATNVELYRWLLSQMATLYFQAYDAVVGLCLSAEASWQYEMGDFDTQVIRPNVWMDHRHGLSAGESMLLDLLRLERMFLERNERRLELTKTISLRQLFENATTPKTWDAVIKELEKGTLDFEFSQQLFDSDYPGHYCRQITTVALSLPAVLGPYQDVRAILTQTGSTTVHKADVQSLEYLYGDVTQVPPGILLNPRSNQQVGISHGLDDVGLFQLVFGDERYLPFEGTGAVSHWRLELPRSAKSDDQVQLIESLTDIIVQVRYLAKVGGTAYTEAVLDKLGD